MDNRTLRVLEYNKIIEMLSKYARSSLGKKLVMELQPSANRGAVVESLDETTEAESITAIEGSGFITSFPDIYMQLKKARIGSILSPKEIHYVGQVLSVAKCVKDRMNQHKAKSTLIIIPSLVIDINSQRELFNTINRSIENEDQVSDHASSELANIRRLIAITHDRIRERLNSIIHSPQYLKLLQEPIVTIRNDRYVVPVKQENRSSFAGIVHDQSSSGATLFIEPMAVVEANNDLRQLILKEEEEIERILAQLTAEIEAVGDEIEDTLIRLSRLDFIFAKGAFSLALRGVSPKIADIPSVKIINGRHPLIDKDQVVPISLELGRDYDTLMITGPNTGGKTVTLKTVGLFLLMAQSGLHLPADVGTEIGIFHNIFADIGDEQSIEQNLSTFSSHMTNIVKVLSEVNEGDLVLFDELGAGTDPTEGAALAMAILDYLHSRQIRTMATTHYSELKVYALTHEGVENASVEFNVETLSPTYRLLTGIPGKSNAFEISKRLGLMDTLIDDAKQYLSQDAIHFEDIITDMERNRITTEQEREDASQYLKEVESLKTTIFNEREDFDRQKSAIIIKAREEAKRILTEARYEADTIIKELQQLARVTEEKERNKAIDDARKRFKNKLSSIEEGLSSAAIPSNTLLKPPKNLQLGETVYIVNLDQKGQVLSKPDDGGDLMVQVGIMKVNVHLTNIRRSQDDTSTKDIKSGKNITIRTSYVTTELNLRGMNAGDALINTDKYLDDAFLAGLKEVTIIHGKGTGILRSNIHQHLKQHTHVESYRLGKYGEGESGVTIVTLK